MERAPQKIFTPFIRLSHRFPSFLEHPGSPKYDLFFFKKIIGASSRISKKKFGTLRVPFFKKKSKISKKKISASRRISKKRTPKRFFDILLSLNIQYKQPN